MLGDVNSLLADTAEATARYLGEMLPELTNQDWWECRVLRFLSFSQRNIVQRNRYTQLSQLDLAALLHTLDNNWRAIDGIQQFPSGALNFVKEMRAVRNRWSHMTATPEYVADDIYRDLDTIERFLAIIDADTRLLEKVRAERIAVAAEILKAHSPTVPDPVASSVELAAEKPIAAEPDTPSCPVCGNMMVLRTARAGPYAGNKFWGCSEWSITGCGGIINLPKQSGTDTELLPPNCPNCESQMVLRTARTGHYAGNQFWGCSEWSITGCNGLRNIPQDQPATDVDDLPF